MPSLSQKRIIKAFKDGDTATTAHARGKALEELIAYIMRRIPGVRLQEKDILTANNSEEIDLVFWNDCIPGGLPFLPYVLMFECKNWSSPVGSPEVGFFRLKAEERHLEYAFLIAANGVTGDAGSLSAANQVIDTAFIQKRLHLIVITRAELLLLTSTEMFVRMVQDKISKIVMRVKQI